MWRYHRATLVNYSRPKAFPLIFIVEGCKYEAKTAALILASQVNIFLTIKCNYISRQQNDFHVYYEPPFISTVRDYAFPPVITAFWRAVCVVYHLGLNLFCHSDWRGKLASINDGGRSIRQPVFLLLAFCSCADTSSPLRPLLNAALIGLLLLAVGNGMVTVAEHQNVPSGIAAVVVATVPLFTLCFSRLFGIKTRKLEWVGIAIGLAGIIMLNSGGNLSGNPWGAILILIGSISWAFGSVYGSRITLPAGMMAGAIEMLAAGVVLMIASMIAGEKLTALPSLSGFLAVGYLALFGSIIAINAYMYLIRNVSPALATSYAYVNPVVAVLLGTGLGGETLSKIEWLALGVIVFAVILVTLGKYLFPAKPVVAPVIQDASSE